MNTPSLLGGIKVLEAFQDHAIKRGFLMVG